MGHSALIAGAALCALAAQAASAAAAEAQTPARLPDFSGLWTRAGDTPSTFEPPPGGPSAIMTAVPHRGHCVSPENAAQGGAICADTAGGDAASTPWIADTTNPILQPWTREALKKNADNEAKGISHMSAQQNCRPNGVPQILNLRYTVQLLQAKDQVTILYENNQQIRRVYMDRPHPAGLQPSWYGHSVGHYEGDELVIDTVAQRPETELDRFGTLHTEQLHVIERYRMLAPGRMQVTFTVEDPKAFTMPWRGVATYKRTVEHYFPEYICAENNRATNLTQHFAIPVAAKPDF